VEHILCGTSKDAHALWQNIQLTLKWQTSTVFTLKFIQSQSNVDKMLEWQHQVKILVRQEFSYNYYYCENTNRGVQANTNQNKHFYVYLCSL